MEQAAKEGLPKQASSRSTYHAPSSVREADVEHGMPKRKTTSLADAKRSTTRGRVIAVSRRSSGVPEQPKRLVLVTLRIKYAKNHVCIMQRASTCFI